MKVYQLLEQLKGRSQDDTLMVACGDGQFTDQISLISVRTDPVSNPRHVSLIPLEGKWAGYSKECSCVTASPLGEKKPSITKMEQGPECSGGSCPTCERP